MIGRLVWSLSTINQPYKNSSNNLKSVILKYFRRTVQEFDTEFGLESHFRDTVKKNTHWEVNTNGIFSFLLNVNIIHLIFNCGC